MDAEGRDAASPWKMPWAAWKAVAIRSWNESGDDNIGIVAAGVAFYGFLALVPLLTAVILCYGIFTEPATVIRHMQALTAIMPPDIARTIGEQLLALVRSSDGEKGIGLLFALAVALFGARNGAGAVITALNIAYEEKEKRNFVVVNLTAIAITAAAVVAAIFAALAIAVLSALSSMLPYANDAVVILGTILSYLLLTLGGAAGAAALYRYGPSRAHARWVWLSPGSLFTALLWLALTLGFGSYVANIGKFDATYGSLGAVVALLTWLYLSSYVLLFGAEINAELEHQTALDTTTGAPQPLGARRAWVADHIAEAPVAAPPDPPAEPAPSGERESFIVGRAAVRGARIAGLPKIGWITSGVATLGLTMLRRKGRALPGAALLAAAAGLAWVRREKE
jgi:membrane protein